MNTQASSSRIVVLYTFVFLDFSFESFFNDSDIKVLCAYSDLNCVYIQNNRTFIHYHPLHSCFIENLERLVEVVNLIGMKVKFSLFISLSFKK